MSLSESNFILHELQNVLAKMFLTTHIIPRSLQDISQQKCKITNSHAKISPYNRYLTDMQKLSASPYGFIDEKNT